MLTEIKFYSYKTKNEMKSLDLAKKISEGVMPYDIVNEIEAMDSYKKHLETLRSKCKPLVGTDKQIAWAEKIRQEKFENAAYHICVNNAMRKGAELGLKNCLKGFDYDAKLKEILKEAYVYLRPESWIIIENRH